MDSEPASQSCSPEEDGTTMSSNFSPYPSIPNYNKATDIANCKFKTKDAALLNAVHDWVVTEKIHGANFSFIVANDGSVTCAKRTAVLLVDEKFFPYQNVQNEFGEQFKGIFQKLAAKESDLEQLQVFGELFGGLYPHPDVKQADPNFMGVQLGIYYHPEVKFEIFDIRISIGGENPHGYFMDWDVLESIASEFGIPHSPVLFRGPLDEAVRFNERFPSIIYKRYGLPEIANNLAEGVVIRPSKEMSSYPKQSRRYFLKKKRAEFQETASDRPTKPSKPPQGDNPELAAAKVAASERITENRLDAAISKVGPLPEKGNFKKIWELFIKDVLQDLTDTDAPEWHVLQETDIKKAQEFVVKECQTIIVKRMNQIRVDQQLKT